MKGGIIYEVIEGPRLGKYAQAAHRDQTDKFEALNKVLVEYFEDSACALPVLENGRSIVNLTSINKLKQVGFYD